MQTKFSDGSVGVCGILPRAAEFKIGGQKNTKICNFSVKIGERDTGGEKPEAIWCNCTCFGQLAEDVKHLKKLDVVFAVGRLERKEYTDKTDGTTKTRTSLICEGIFRGMLPLAAAPAASSQQAAPPPQLQIPNAADPYSDDGDLPF